MKKLFNISDIFFSNWEQLTADQAAMVLIYKNLIQKNNESENYKQAGIYRFALARILSKKTKILRSLSADQIFDLVEDLHFINKPFFAFHVIYIDTRIGRILPPEEYLSSFTFYQFIKADSEFSKYMVLSSKDDAEQLTALNRLIAIIYQPIPGSFNEFQINDYAGSLPKSLTLDLKLLILNTYLCCRNYIVEKRCPNLFHQEAGASGEPQYLGPMWQELLYDLSDTPAFSGIDRAKNARLYEALDYLEKKAKEKPVMQ